MLALPPYLRRRKPFDDGGDDEPRRPLARKNFITGTAPLTEFGGAEPNCFPEAIDGSASKGYIAFVDGMSDHTYDHSLARCSLFVTTQHVGYLNPDMAQRLRIRGVPDTCWFQGVFLPDSIENPDQQQVFGFSDGSSPATLAVMPRPGFGPFALGKLASLQLAHWDDGISNWTYDGDPTPEMLWGNGAPITLTMRLNGGAVTIFLDGVMVLDGQLNGSGSTSVLDVGVISRGGTWWSELMIQSTNPMGKRLLSAPPTTLGTRAEWIGDSSAMNTLPITDTQFVNTVSIFVESFNIAAAPDSDTGIDAVCTWQRLAVVSGGHPDTEVNGVSAYLASIAGTQTTGEALHPAAGFGSSPCCFSGNPATLTDFQPGDFGEGFNVGVIATAPPPAP